VTLGTRSKHPVGITIGTSECLSETNQQRLKVAGSELGCGSYAAPPGQPSSSGNRA
jgi:hypothetical protein